MLQDLAKVMPNKILKLARRDVSRVATLPRDESTHQRLRAAQIVVVPGFAASRSGCEALQVAAPCRFDRLDPMSDSLRQPHPGLYKLVLWPVWSCSPQRKHVASHHSGQCFRTPVDWERGDIQGE